ncbi:MAG: 50S ribosomal protein L22, partial [uncultured bacterium]
SRALEILALTQKLAAKPIVKLLNSAIANASHNHQLNVEGLVIQSITVDGGPMLKRWMPKAHGRATPIRERTAHINLVLADLVKKPAKKKTTK